MIQRVALGRRIVAVRCADDRIVFQGVSPAQVRRSLLGRRIRAVHRRGKHLWLELDRRPWPIFHFGMTGGFHSPAVKSVKLKSSGNKDRGPQWPPRFWKLQMKFSGGGELVMTDARRLGRIRLRHDPRNEPPISLLGFDALHELPSSRKFHELLHPRTSPIKAVLLDQGFSAGVGNWIADEVLYQARIDPRRRTNTLTRAEIARLRTRLRSVVGTAVRVGADSDRFPPKWLFHTRWSKRLQSPVTVRGERIRYLTVGGRTTAWVAEVQR